MFLGTALDRCRENFEKLVLITLRKPFLVKNAILDGSVVSFYISWLYASIYQETVTGRVPCRLILQGSVINITKKSRKLLPVKVDSIELR